MLWVEQSPISPLYLPYVFPTSLLYPYISADLAHVLWVEQSPISPLYLPYISPTSLLYLPYISADLARVLRVEQPPRQRAEPIVVRAFRVRAR